MSYNAFTDSGFGAFIDSGYDARSGGGQIYIPGTRLYDEMLVQAWFNTTIGGPIATAAGNAGCFGFSGTSLRLVSPIDGDAIWSIPLPYDSAITLTAMPDGGAVVLASDSNGANKRLVRYDASGNYLWDRNLDTQDGVAGGSNMTPRLASDPDGNIFGFASIDTGGGSYDAVLSWDEGGSRRWRTASGDIPAWGSGRYGAQYLMADWNGGVYIGGPSHSPSSGQYDTPVFHVNGSAVVSHGPTHSANRWVRGLTMVNGRLFGIEYQRDPPTDPTLPKLVAYTPSRSIAWSRDLPPDAIMAFRPLYPWGITHDSEGNIYVSFRMEGTSPLKHPLYKYSFDGELLLINEDAGAVGHICGESLVG